MECLLEKNPEIRLGSPALGGVNSIKNHIWFKGTDWDKVLNKKLKPPINPKVKSVQDTKNIDKGFLQESIRNTPEKDSHLDSTDITFLNSMKFKNFTYNEDQAQATLEQYEQFE